MSFRNLICVVLMWLLPLLSFAIPTKGFRHITVNDGLSRNSIYSLLQDSSGLIYIGTWDALHRFDGTEIRELIFTPTAANPTRIVTSLAEGPNDKIYIGTTSGIIIWNTRTETAAELQGGFAGSVSQLLADNKGNIHILDTAGKHHILDGTTDSIAGTPQDAQCLVTTTEGNVMALTSGLLPSKSIMAAMAGPGGELWVSTKQGDVYHRAGGATTFRKLDFPGGAKPAIVKFARYGSSVVMASGRGLWVYDPSSDSMTHIVAAPDDPAALNDMKVIELMTDREGGLWVGTFFGGINYMSPTKGNFTTFTEVNSGIDGHVVSSITTDSHGYIWFGVEDGGLSRYNPSTGSIENYNSRNRHGALTPTVDNIQGLHAVGDTLYVGMAWGGMDIFLISENRRIAHYPPSSSAPDFPSSVYAFSKGPDEAIYIGTMSGLFRYRPASGNLSRVTEFPRTIVHTLVTNNSDGRLWTASQGGGVYSFDGKRWTPLSNSPELHMAMSVFPTDSTIYVGTEGHGLYSFDLRKNQTRRVDLGLSGRLMVFSILSDGNYLWITTNRGLAAYNPQTGQTIRFTTHDGLQSNQFKINSSLRLTDGTIITGCVNGINAFTPKELLLNLTQPIPIIVESIIEHEIPDSIPTSRADQINLPAGHTGLRLRLASSSYDDPSKNRFEYRLEGYDDEWRQTPEGVNEVSYPALKHGDYIFRLRTANGNGVFGPERRLAVSVSGKRDARAITYIIIGVITGLVLAISVLAAALRIKKNRRQDLHPVCLPDIHPEEQDDESADFLRRLNEIIAREIDNVELSVDDLAVKTGVGRSIFYRKVKAATGQTPNEYLRTLRLNRAAELLRRPGARVNQVCYQTGFSSPSYFSRCFTSRFGISPSDYAAGDHEQKS